MKNNNFKLADIPQSQLYEGYLWWSNANKPIIFVNEPLSQWPEESANPFILEGQLFDKQNQKSFSIRFVDGSYLIHSFNLIELQNNEYINKEYLPERMDGVSKLCFREYWKPEKDAFCEDMKVLKPAEIVFAGFKFKEE